MALREWPKLSDREISRICGVDDHTAKISREALEATAEIPQLKTRTGADGRERRLKVKPTPEAPERPRVQSSAEILAEQRAEREALELASCPAPESVDESSDPIENGDDYTPPAKPARQVPEPKARHNSTELEEKFMAIWSEMDETEHEFAIEYVVKWAQITGADLWRRHA